MVIEIYMLFKEFFKFLYMHVSLHVQVYVYHMQVDISRGQMRTPLELKLKAYGARDLTWLQPFYRF